MYTIKELHLITPLEVYERMAERGYITDADIAESEIEREFLLGSWREADIAYSAWEWENALWDGGAPVMSAEDHDFAVRIVTAVLYDDGIGVRYREPSFGADNEVMY